MIYMTSQVTTWRIIVTGKKSIVRFHYIGPERKRKKFMGRLN